MSELAQRYAALEGQLTASDTSKAAALARNYELEQALASEKVSRESTAAMLAMRDRELADSKTSVAELTRKVEQQQMGFDREMNDLRTQLGQEMVASHKNKSKFTEVTEELQDLKTKFAVSEEMFRSSKLQMDRLEADIGDKQAQVERLEKDREAANIKVAEMQTRIDCKEQQHAQVIATMSLSQDLQTTRLKELEKERDAALEDLKQAKAESEDLTAQVYQARQEHQNIGVELRMAESQLEQASKSIKEKVAEGEALKIQLADVVKAKAEINEAHAVMQAEFAIFKEQTNMPKQIEEQIERLCKQQTENRSAQVSKET